MAPSTTAPAQPKRRQSCDRCHGQKLRCIRTGESETGACNRCIRQGAQCVYSSSLPKGRPSMYRLAETNNANAAAAAAAAAANSNPPPPAPVSPELRRQHSAGPHASSPNASATHHTTNHNQNHNPNHNHNHNHMSTSGNLSVTDDVFAGGPMDTSNWSWLPPLNWDDMQVDSGHSGEFSQWISNSHTILNPQTDAGAALLDAFPCLLGFAGSPGHQPSSLPSPPHFSQHGHGFGGDPFDSSSTSSTSSRSMSMSMSIDPKSGPDMGIERLSQLSTRLYLLHRSSCNLAETQSSNRGRQTPLIDDAALKSVASWLVHVSANMTLLTDRQTNGMESRTTGDTLHDAFSASQNLLEILRCLQSDSVNGAFGMASAPLTTTGTDMDFWASVTHEYPQSAPATALNDQISYFEPTKSGSSSNYATPRPQQQTQASQYSNTVVRHLVSACHTLLLNVYVAVLTALQHDADLWRSNRSSGNTSPHPSSSSLDGLAGGMAGMMNSGDGTALADIRLVLVVQLCSYLIERQHQAVDLYLSPEPTPPSSLSMAHDPALTQQPTDFMGMPSTLANRDVMSDLEMEVQQRLARLRQTLRI